MGIVSAIGALGGFEGVAGKIGGLIDSLHTSTEEKQRFRLDMERLLQERDREIEASYRAELAAHKEIVLAEIQSGSPVIRMARPSIIYIGVFVTFFNYILTPLLMMLFNFNAPELEIPVDFWLVWGGVVSVYSVGRSAERRGLQNRHLQKAAGFINGTPKGLR